MVSKKTGEMKEVVSKKLLKIRNTMDYHDFERPHRVFQKADFQWQIGKFTVFLKPCSKLKSHFISAILMKKNIIFSYKTEFF